ncbi:hypothetical protein EXIGLDRAFT_744555 [Exidia glandulosa HHB12029]|uniref:CFEM domain-containing protein n=1 Tax=Exidia glandulosa HHB12029 TaxID=1314781 RepID=A0A165PLV5_EXIGL|nr:hypothetical protein EXIGLDRAFT_744555 [Exidia glandulosa HHB12029]
MRVRSYVATLLLSAALLANAQNETSSSATECVVSCGVDAVHASGCNPDAADYTSCACTSEVYLSTFDACMQLDCPGRFHDEGLQLFNQTCASGGTGAQVPQSSHSGDGNSTSTSAEDNTTSDTTGAAWIVQAGNGWAIGLLILAMLQSAVVL